MSEEFTELDAKDTPLELNQAEIRELSPGKFLYEITMSGDEDLHDQASDDILQRFNVVGGNTLALLMNEPINVGIETKSNSLLVDPCDNGEVDSKGCTTIS